MHYRYTNNCCLESAISFCSCARIVQVSDADTTTTSQRGKYASPPVPLSRSRKHLCRGEGFDSPDFESNSYCLKKPTPKPRYHHHQRTLPSRQQPNGWVTSYLTLSEPEDTICCSTTAPVNLQGSLSKELSNSCPSPTTYENQDTTIDMPLTFSNRPGVTAICQCIHTADFDEDTELLSFCEASLVEAETKEHRSFVNSNAVSVEIEEAKHFIEIDDESLSNLIPPQTLVSQTREDTLGSQTMPVQPQSYKRRSSTQSYQHQVVIEL